MKPFLIALDVAVAVVLGAVVLIAMSIDELLDGRPRSE